MVPVTSMLAAISGKPCHSEPVCRNRNVRLTSTALRVLRVERFGRMRTSLKSSLTSVSMRMSDPACAGKWIASEFSDCGRKPQRSAFLGGNAMEDRAIADELVLYTNPMSRGRVARWMLEEVGQPFRAEILEYARSMKAPEYPAINPMGKVPALRHGEAVVTETAAICAYLADAFPAARLAPPPGDKLRAPYYRWLFFTAGPVEYAVTNKALGFVVPPDRERMMGYGNIGQVMSALE